ncbi:2787_t:CDS:2 [Acaulospora colombiana]|uniref:2787_t:CDS:1 n=1 Tax=Acaulospora colombiana TaxID=27376 RepID=A0ACA9NE23_9GLOM|nr:2787_t:CDS:2 [Acaulospora colombiana]
MDIWIIERLCLSGQTAGYHMRGKVAAIHPRIPEFLNLLLEIPSKKEAAAQQAHTFPANLVFQMFSQIRVALFLVLGLFLSIVHAAPTPLAERALSTLSTADTFFNCELELWTYVILVYRVVSFLTLMQLPARNYLASKLSIVEEMEELYSIGLLATILPCPPLSSSTKEPIPSNSSLFCKMPTFSSPHLPNPSSPVSLVVGNPAWASWINTNIPDKKRINNKPDHNTVHLRPHVDIIHYLHSNLDLTTTERGIHNISQHNTRPLHSTRSSLV